MIDGAQTRRLYESYSRGDSNCDGVSGPAGFVQLTRKLLGITRDDTGRKVIHDRQMRPEEFDFRDLAEAIVGPDWYTQLGTSDNGGVPLLEDANSAVQPSAFNNISAWNSTVAGLLEAKILEGYRRPEFIADRLASTRPTRLRRDRLIGVTEVEDLAENMKPGQRHPRAQFGERYVTTPETQKRGLAIDITRETVYFDQTRSQVLERAESVGFTLGLRKERMVIDTFLGIDNTYTYKDATSNTYQAAGQWTNEQSNPLVDWTSVDASQQLFSEMTNPDTGEPIAVIARDIFVMPARELSARRTFNASGTQFTNGTETTSGNNPLTGLGFNLLPASVYAYNRLTDTDGLNIIADDAKDYWFHGDFQRAFAYMENWSTTVRRASPDSYAMADQDLVLSIFANEMGIPAVLEPRQVVRNTN